MRHFHTKFLYLLLFIFSVSDSYAAAEGWVRIDRFGDEGLLAAKAPVAKLLPIARTAIETSFSKTLKILPQMTEVLSLYLYSYPHEESAPVLRRRAAPKPQIYAGQETMYEWLASQLGL